MVPSSGTNLAKNELLSREALDEFNPWRQRLSMDLFGSGTEQTAADSFELCSIGARKDLDPARSRLDRLRREIERCSLAYSS